MPRKFASRRFAVASAALALAAFVGRAPAEEARPGRDLERSLEDLADHVVPRTACVYGAIGLGSGAVVDHAGTVVTNAHVALAARVAILEFADGRRVVARRRGIDFERDLAVLEPEEPLGAPVPCFELGRGRPTPGTWVAAVGYPAGPRGDLQPTFSVGQVVEGGGLASPVMGLLNYSDAIRSDIAIFEGNSGGPLVDRDGRLLGINGAFEPGTGSAFSIPLDVVIDRLRTLRGGVMRFPGGRELDDSNSLVALLGKQLDPVVRRLVERVHAGFDPDPKGENVIEKTGPEVEAAREARAKVVENELRSPRSVALAKLFESVAPRGQELALELEGGILATRIARGYAVAKRSLVSSRSTFQVEPAGTARVVAEDAENDLALLALDDAAATPFAPEPDAGARATGSIVAGFSPRGVLGAGVVSVRPRAIPEAVSLRIAGGAASRARMLEVVRGAKRFAERLGGPVRSLVESLEAQLATMQALATGSDPRGYAHVLSHDAALLPSQAGAPLVDLDGRLVGINISNANYGTSYVVPVSTVRATFRGVLGTASVPGALGKATLH